MTPIILLAVWIAFLFGYGVWIWTRKAPDHLGGWWHDDWYGKTRNQRGFSPDSWTRACDQSNHNSRARRGLEG